MLDLAVGNLTEPFGERRWSRDDVRREVSARAGRLEALGLAAGDRVILTFGNRLEFFAELLAIWRLGACAIPLDARLTAFEAGNIAMAAAAKFAVCDEDTTADVVAGIQRAGTTAVSIRDSTTANSDAARAILDADALMLFTSGSTGDPKGVVHTHRTLRARWTSLRDHLPVEAFARTLCMLPTHFGHGLICNSLFPWLSGNDLYITPPFRADLLARVGKLIDEHRITFMSSVPSIWKLALKLAASPARGSLQRVHVGSAPLSAASWEEIRKWTGTRQVCNAYGITETGSWVAGLADADVPAEDGLIGTGWGAVLKVLRSRDTDCPPDAGLECKVGEPGHVWLNTPALMKGYFRRDELTRSAVVNGWFLTGDIGYLDASGRLYLSGRERDEINKGGMKIYPSDIDTVVERYESARDVCAFALEDPIYGQVVGIAVVLKDSEPETIRGMYAWMKDRLADHKMPSRWWLVEEIPRTSRGKVNRDAVRARCEQLPPLAVASLVPG